MQRTDDESLDTLGDACLDDLGGACGDACLDAYGDACLDAGGDACGDAAALPLGLLGLPDQILTMVLTNAINQSFEFLGEAIIERPDFGDWKSLFKWRLISRRFCKLIDGSVLLATGAAPLLAAAVWTSLYDAIRRQHRACTLEYSLPLRARLLELADKTSDVTEALATREALYEEADKLKPAPRLREWLYWLCSDVLTPENYTYAQRQIRIIAEEINKMNPPMRDAELESLSHYVTSSILRRLICSGQKFPDLSETPQIIVMWAATSDMAAEDIPYPLRCLCKSWQLAPQQEGHNLQQGLIGTIHDNAFRQFNDQLYVIRRTKCTFPDCKLNKN